MVIMKIRAALGIIATCVGREHILVKTPIRARLVLQGQVLFKVLEYVRLVSQENIFSQVLLDAGIVGQEHGLPQILGHARLVPQIQIRPAQVPRLPPVLAMPGFMDPTGAHALNVVQEHILL